MNSEKIKLAMRVAEKYIDEFETKLVDAIKKEDWNFVAEINTYLKDAKQIFVIFEQALDQDELK